MNLKKAYLVAPKSKGNLEGFPGALTAIKNYLDFSLGENNPSQIVEGFSDLDVKDEENIIVGITAASGTYNQAIQTARKIKQQNSEAKIILGGHHTKKGTGQDEMALKKYAGIIDYVCVEDGEKTIEALMLGKEKEDVPNIAYLENDEIKYSRSGNLSIAELSQIPFRLYKTKTKKGKLDEDVAYVASRGCKYRCSFCAAGTQGLRAKSIDRIVEDLKYLKNEGNRRIAFEDNYFLHNIRKSEELAKKIIAEKIDIKWTAQTRADCLPVGKELDEFIRLLTKSGLDRLYLGIENFNRDLLLAMNKTKHPAEYTRRILESAKTIIEQPIELGSLFIFGRPEENELAEQTNLENLTKLSQIADGKNGNIVIYPSLSVVYPGTNDAEKLKSAVGDWDEMFEEYNLWEEKNPQLIDFLSKNFAHGRGGIPWGILNGDKLREKQFEIDEERLKRVIYYLSRIKTFESSNFKVYNYEKDIS